MRLYCIHQTPLSSSEEGLGTDYHSHYTQFHQPLQPKTSLLHPLTSLEWSEYCEMPVTMYNAQAVVLENKTYIGGGDMYPGSSSRLLAYDFTKDLWDTLKTPTQWFALTTYHSQLVLVGGRDPNTWEAISQVWVLDECHWIQPLPPMTTERYYASAASVGDHLIVAGGRGSDRSPLATVEMYDGHQWRQVQSLPRACPSMKSTVLEGNWYLANGTRQGSEIYYISLESLVATFKGALVWGKLPDTPLEQSTLAVLKNQLITVGAEYCYKSAIHAYSSNTNSWVHVGYLPVACYSPCTLVHPTGELLVVGTRPGLSSCLFRADVGGNFHNVYIYIYICAFDTFTLCNIHRNKAVFSTNPIKFGARMGTIVFQLQHFTAH